MGKSGATSSKKRDNLEAARIVRDALHGFTAEDQKKILRWAAESLGIASVSSSPPALSRAQQPPSTTPSPQQPEAPKPLGSNATKNIKSFVDEKQPQTDIQLAATIAYFYRFEAPEAERKEEIDAAFLRDACRLAGRPGQLKKPLATLNNAQAKGLLDRGDRGKFSINSVGENLVGMTLPMKSAKGKAPKT